MTRTPDEKLVLLFEALKRSLLVLDLNVEKLREELRSLEPDIDASDELGERVVPPLLAAAAFVDFAFRFAGVAEALPRINKKAAAYRNLRAAIKPVENARHYFQHMRGDLSSSAEISYPIFGALSWIGGDACYVVLLSQPGSATTPSIAWSVPERRWTAQLVFFVRDSEIDIDQVAAAARALYDSVVAQLHFEPQSLGDLSWGKTQSMALRVYPVDD